MEAASNQLRDGLVVAGRYRIERRIGQGGMSAVYLVRHVHTDERLALKVLDASLGHDAAMVERFRREARAPARIDSDHVVRVTDADVAPELGGAPFLVMEFLKGHDLEREAEERGALPPAEVVRHLEQAARALDKAHAIGIVHRDLKPENLFLTQREDGTSCVKVLDFGIAKITLDADLGAMRTQTGTIFGTPSYMSPEQAQGAHDSVGPHTDVWAFGLTAHRLLTGRELWQPTSLAQLVAMIVYDPMPVPSALGVRFGPAYDAWFARCCARDPAARFRTTGEAAHALAEALGGGQVRPSVPQGPAPDMWWEEPTEMAGSSSGLISAVHSTRAPLGRSESAPPPSSAPAPSRPFVPSPPPPRPTAAAPAAPVQTTGATPAKPAKVGRFIVAGVFAGIVVAGLVIGAMIVLGRAGGEIVEPAPSAAQAPSVPPSASVPAAESSAEAEVAEPIADEPPRASSEEPEPAASAAPSLP